MHTTKTPDSAMLHPGYGDFIRAIAKPIFAASRWDRWVSLSLNPSYVAAGASRLKPLLRHGGCFTLSEGLIKPLSEGLSRQKTTAKSLLISRQKTAAKPLLIPFGNPGYVLPSAEEAGATCSIHPDHAGHAAGAGFAAVGEEARVAEGAEAAAIDTIDADGGEADAGQGVEVGQPFPGGF